MMMKKKKRENNPRLRELINCKDAAGHVNPRALTRNEMNTGCQAFEHVPRIQKCVHGKYESHRHNQQSEACERCLSPRQI